MSMKRLAGIALLLALIGAALTIKHGKVNAAGHSTAPSPPDVEVATVEQCDVPVEREWVGSLDGMVNADIKAQVTGYLMTRNYVEGSFVHKGQLLFQIDARPFEAAVDQAAGQLAQAKAQVTQAQASRLQAEAQLDGAEENQIKAQLDEDKYVPLAKEQAVTRQDMDNARQTNRVQKAQVDAARAQLKTSEAQIEAAKAGVASAEASLETARVNLGFTRLTAPIDGIAGAAAVQVGNLVGPAANAITTISTIDPVKANVSVSEQEYLSLTRADALHHLQLKLILADGSEHPVPGRFSFADRNVDLNTGAIQLTSVFANPGNILRPGQYARVRATVGLHTAALLVPQRALIDTQGSYMVAVVDPDNSVRFTPVKAGDRVGSNWIVEQGLRPGERVVTDGLFHIRPGAVVNPKGGR